MNTKEVCNCKDDNYIRSEGSFDLSGRFINKFAPINENSKFQIISGKINNLVTERSNCDTSNCNPTKQQKLAVRRRPTPYRVPYNHYRKRFTCQSNCTTNIKIIKDKSCDINCQKTTYGITRLVDSNGVRIRNNGGNYSNYLQAAGKTFSQNSAGIVPINRTSNDIFSFKLQSGTVFNKNFNTTDNSNCMITNQRANSLTSQSFSIRKIPTTVKKYRNNRFSSNTSVSSKNRLLQLKYNTTLAGQITRNGYNNCLSGQICSLYQQTGPHTKMYSNKPNCKNFIYKGIKQSCEIPKQIPNTPSIVYITGITIETYELRANINDTDRFSISAVRFQWMRDNNNIQGAIYQQYKLTKDDIGKKIKVAITFVDNLGYNEIAVSNETNTIKENNHLGSVNITCSPHNSFTKHNVLTANIIDNDNPYKNVSYQWYRFNTDTNNESIIINANEQYYTLIHTDVGNLIRVKVTYTDNNNFIENVISPFTPVIKFPPNQPGSVIINNNSTQGSTISATISDNNGISTSYIQYNWYRIDSGPPQVLTHIGTNSRNYTLTADDVGKTIRVDVVYRDDDLYLQEISSAPSAVIT